MGENIRMAHRYLSTLSHGLQMRIVKAAFTCGDIVRYDALM